MRAYGVGDSIVLGYWHRVGRRTEGRDVSGVDGACQRREASHDRRGRVDQLRWIWRWDWRRQRIGQRNGDHREQRNLIN